MIAPHKFTQLYRKENLSDEIDPRQVALDDYYDRYNTEVDLLQVDQVVEGYWDPTQISVLFMLSGRAITVVAPMPEVSLAIYNAREQWKVDQLMVFRN